MARRIAFGTLMIAVIGGALYLDWVLGLECRPGSPLHMLPTAVVLLVLVVLGYSELTRLAAAAGVGLLGVSGLVFSAALATIVHWGPLVQSLSAPGVLDRPATIGHWSPLVQVPDIPYATVLVMAYLPAALLAMFVEQMVRHKVEMAFQRVGATLLATMYLGLGGFFILAIRSEGVPWLVVFLAAVKFTDIGAYFTGSAIGRHKIIPWLSPGKSWEGLAGGLVVGAGAAMLAMRLLLGRAITPSTVIWAVAVGLAGQFGDLCESLLKRSANLKDSGALVPEFGGVLDIIDSPLLAAPVAMWLWWLLHP